jgi:hypothetical protein
MPGDIPSNKFYAEIERKERSRKGLMRRRKQYLQFQNWSKWANS